MALVFAAGFARPGAAARPIDEAHQRMLRFVGPFSFTTMALLFFATPWFAHNIWPGNTPVLASVKANEAIVSGGRRTSGFLVVPDDAVLRSGVPTIKFATFSDIVKQSGIEQYQSLLSPTPPNLPFGFVFAPALLGSGHLYIVPPAVIERRDVAMWQFTWSRPSGPYWFYVTSAKPLLR